MFFFTTSMPTPRPDTSVTTSAVEKPGSKIRFQTSMSVIVSGAAIAFCIIAAFTGELALPVTAQGWAVGFAIALIPTMVAISLFLAGLPRIGAARSSLLSTWEPVVTVLLAVVLLGDRLSLVQVLGGVLVLLAVGVVQSASLWKRSAPSAIK